ncbi:MAG: hypothetical protein ACK4HD_06985, partial [Pannonibacter phragmitetus]
KPDTVAAPQENDRVAAKHHHRAANPRSDPCKHTKDRPAPARAAKKKAKIPINEINKLARMGLVPGPVRDLVSSSLVSFAFAVDHTMVTS